MKRDDFKDYLTANGIQWKEADGKIVTDGGGVFLDSLTTLPENVQFNNGWAVSLKSLTTLPENVQFNNAGTVYLDSLTTLPENVQFNNGWNVYLSSLTLLPENVQFNNSGYVYLDSLTTLPENVQFNNGGSVSLRSLTTLPENVQFNNGENVSLRSLTTLPENVQFNNGGYVYFDSLTTLPENVQFNNGGSVYLQSLTEPTQFYQGRRCTFKFIDGYTMLIESFKRRGEITISKARYFGGGPIEKLKQCFIAESDGDFAHGDTAEGAVRDLNFKVLQGTADLSEIVEQVKSSGEVTAAQYRLLTGACGAGVEHFLESKGIPAKTKSLPLKEVIAMTQGAFGGEKMKELFA